MTSINTLLAQGALPADGQGSLAAAIQSTTTFARAFRDLCNLMESWEGCRAAVRMDSQMRFDRLARERQASDGGQHAAGSSPGKRTRSESLPVQRREAAPAAEARAAGPAEAAGIAEDPFAVHLRGGPAAGLAPVQMHREIGAYGLEQPAAVQAAAAAGASGSAPLPHLDALQSAFGDHDLSSVRATVGGTAAAACEQIGAESYAQSNTVAFKQRPDVWLAAHEAAHVVQQRGGASIPDGVGRTGDAHEVHADRVADRVAAGGSAADLLGASAQTPANGAAVQRYVAQNVNGVAAKASDSGASVVVPKRTLYAESSLVATANTALTKVGKHGSHIKLVEDAGDTMTQNGITLLHVKPEWVKHAAGDGHHGGATSANDGGADSEGDTSGDMALWTDCGKSSGAVTGSQLNGDRKVVYDKGGTEQVSAGFNDPSQKYQDTPHNFSNQIYTDLLPDFMKDPKHLVYLVSGVHYTEAAGVKTIVTITDAKHAKVLYAQMTAPGRDAFDKAAGTNHYADPAIGESYNMATEANMPGFKETSKKTWNFHWAGVVLKDGADNITLENFAVTGEYAKSKGVPQGEFVDRDWNFDMYGTLNKDQTFHKEHLASNTHGNMATSMVVRTNK